MTAVTPARDPAEVTAAARHANCGECWAAPLEDCWPPDRLHPARYMRAERRGLITRPELAAALSEADGEGSGAVVRETVIGVAA